MSLSVPFEDGQRAFLASVDAFVDAAERLDELALLGASRCHGWSRLDVVSHVVAGWQEMLGGMVSPVREEPTVDAASYWTAFAEEYGDADPVAVLLAQRRRADSYSRPRSALAELRDVAAAVGRGARSMREDRLTWQGHVFSPGDFLATWAVEDVIHQLDLDPTRETSETVPVEALTLARRTVEALVGEALPSGWDDVDAVLIGSGRRPVPDDASSLSGRLPALS